MYFVLLHGQVTSASLGARGAHGMHTGHEVAAFAELIEHSFAHASHDAHAGDDIR